MDFGRVADPSGVDAALPGPDPANLRVSAPGGLLPPPRFFCGVSTWSNPPWVGTVYPEKTKPSRALEEYARIFNVIELNSTHYALPAVAQVERWRAMVGPTFRFCPKLPQDFSHRRQARVPAAEIHACARILRGFGGALGPCFLQFGPATGPEVLPALNAFLAEWPQDLRIAVEFRHRAFFPGGRLSVDAREVLETWGAGLVILDTLGYRELVHLGVTAPFILLRYLGNDGHPVDMARLEAWVDALVGLVPSHATEVHAFLHSPGILEAARLSNAFIRKLERAFHTGLVPWTPRSKAENAGKAGSHSPEHTLFG